MSVLTGKTLGAYAVKEQIGRGGIATVYRAYHAPTERHVAVKVLSGETASDATFKARFEREARVVASLQHVHILPVFDYGQEDGTAFLVMPLIEGGTLSERIRQRPMEPREAGRLFWQLASALDYAHQRGLLHRDIKPGNVLLDNSGNALLADFGLTRLVGGDDSAQLTKSAVIGTPAYMSPEQGQGLELDSRSDLYSLGVLLYEMLTGDVPYKAETPVAVIFKHVADPLPTMENLPASLRAVIHTAMAKDPAARYPTATAIAQALEAALEGNAQSTPVSDEFPTIQGRGDMPSLSDEPTLNLSGIAQAKKPATVRRTWAGLAALLGVMAVLLLGVVFVAQGDDEAALDAVLQEALASTWQTTAHTGAARRVVYSPDGATIVTGGADDVVRVWDAADHSARYTLEGHSGDILALGYSPDGREFQSGSADSQSRTWDPATGLQKTLNFEGGAIASLAYSPRYVAYASGANLAISYNREQDGETINLIHYLTTDALITALAFSPDETYLASGHQDGRLILWEVESGTEINPLVVQSPPLTALAFVGDVVFVGDAGGVVVAWNYKAGESLSEVEVNPEDGAIRALASSGGRLAIAWAEGWIEVYAAGQGDGDPLAEFETEAELWDVALSPDGKQLAAVGADGVLRVWALD